MTGGRVELSPECHQFVLCFGSKHDDIILHVIIQNLNDLSLGTLGHGRWRVGRSHIGCLWDGRCFGDLHSVDCAH